MSDYLADCVLGHEHIVDVVLVDEVAPSRPGKRGGYKLKRHKMTPPTCPTCGHSWGKLVPAARTEEEP